MSYQEKKNIVSLISTLLIFSLYSLYVFYMYEEGKFQTTDVFSFWGTFIVILIAISIVAKIIIYIIFNIIYRITTNEKEPTFSDELDKLIKMKATTISHYVFVGGFFLAMGSLVLNVSPYVMFIILIFSGVISEMVGMVTEIYLYRRGF
ncbi:MULTISPECIES: hypothetical protein [Bacillaceae]|uniref:hypothetical protein n=1 Tax=Bacillaceae TaxID=186817 RepID=UPI0006F1D00D|nr:MULTISPECIES: hypothetical protein [Bacillaceae]KQL35345.1 hypothetical protein AN959_10485 [Psychrobacillus sp. FJAT-21963]MDF2065580.1 hypothetical protein [Bacillus sp. Cr_A10]